MKKHSDGKGEMKTDFLWDKITSIENPKASTKKKEKKRKKASRRRKVSKATGHT